MGGRGVRLIWTLVDRRVMDGPELVAHYKAEERDFSRAHFNFADLSGTDLRGIDLSGAELLDVDLRGAKLVGADLSWASLLGAIIWRTRT
jgi:uncharacterized protein YjbI with pentapeptide repeats